MKMVSVASCEAPAVPSSALTQEKKRRGRTLVSPRTFSGSMGWLTEPVESGVTGLGSGTLSLTECTRDRASNRTFL